MAGPAVVMVPWTSIPAAVGLVLLVIAGGREAGRLTYTAMLRCGTGEFVADGRGFTHVTSGTYTPWTSLIEVVETDEHFILITSVTGGCVVPKRDVGGPAEVTRLAELIGSARGEAGATAPPGAASAGT
jgi:hypothetical protein